jgi:bifunctional DNA-binding transcriptional regulator/antitoxin component of YhaV-PrlF toxin-antitoxin module
MELTRLSSKGQVIIPEALRAVHHWEAGQELIAYVLPITLNPMKFVMHLKTS